MIGRWAAAIVTAALLSAPAAISASEVRAQLVDAAGEIARLLKDEKQTEVGIKEFTGPSLPSTSAGPMIQAVLLEELKKHKVGINDAAFVCVGGKYFVLDDMKSNNQLTVRLLLALRDKRGKKIAELARDIGYRGNEDLVKLLGMNADLQKLSRANRKTQNQKLRQQLKDPPLYIDGPKVKVGSASPYTVEVLTRPAGGGRSKLLALVAKKGQAFAPIARGEEYVLRLHNQSKSAVAASITIDGVDAFQFYESAGERPGSFFIGPGKTCRIEGWARRAEKVSAFQVGSFIDSAAYKALKGSYRVGTITVCFHPCWEGKTPTPGYHGARSVDLHATGLGREMAGKSRLVTTTIGPLAAAVSIRYNK
jgi:hypothetical protein